MTLSDAIIQTLTYSDHFNFPLTKEEIHSRLIQKTVSLARLVPTLDLLVKTKEVVQSRNYYCLPGRVQLIPRRLARAKISQAKARLANDFASKFGNIPGVVAVYLTGSLAVNNAAENDDLDFMIITSPGVLWLTRLLLTLYAEVLGIRRRPGSISANNQLCLNLYLTTTSLSIPRSKRSLYTAYELIQAVPIYDPHQTQSSLFHKNSWLYKYLPNFPKPRFKISPITYNLPAQAGPSPITYHLNSLAYHLQLLYMRRKLTTEYVTKSRAFFHPNNPGSKIML